MKIFARPNKAFHDYERSLLRPCSWPPTAHDVPTLWMRAKDLFGVMLAAIVSAAALAQRLFLPRQERRALIARLAPVEKLARLLLMTEAATFLLTDPKGIHLRQTAKTVPPPASCTTMSACAATSSTRIPMPGWHTIAALRPRLDPRIEERRGIARAAIDPRDPATWKCRFQVLSWRRPGRAAEAEAEAEAAPQTHASPRRAWAMSLDDDAHFPTLPCSPRRLRAGVHDDEHDHDASTLALARRIEALSRVLANPLPAIRRLARFLAGLPHDALEPPILMRWQAAGWWHGVPETFNACDHASRAITAFLRAEPRLLEPG